MIPTIADKVGAAALLLALAPMALGQTPTPTQAMPTPAPPTFEERLNVQEIEDGLLLGGQPGAADYATLAKEHQVTRVVCLVPKAEFQAEEPDATQAAGLELVRMPFSIQVESDASTFDREEVTRIVKALAQRPEGVTYVHDVSGRGAVGLVDVVYSLQQKNLLVADALLEAFKRGFFAHEFPGLINEIKKFDSGVDTLPTVKGISIASRDLLQKRTLLPVGRQRLHVLNMGKGAPIYTLHGGPGESHVTLRPYFDALSDEFLVVYYDQRGCGHSSQPQFKEAYTVSRLAVELEDLRKVLGHEKINLVAHSSGGVIALRYALTYPEHVDKLVIISTWAQGKAVLPYTLMTSRLFSGDTLDKYATMMRMRLREHRGFTDDEMAELVRLTYPTNFYGVFDAAFRKDWNRRAVISTFANTVMSAEFFRDLDMLGELDGLKVPTLVMCGKYDFVTPPPVMKPIAEAIPNARFELFEKSGHYPYVEEHEKCMQLIREFLGPREKK